MENLHNLLESNYSQLGNISSIEKLSFDFPVANEIYSFTTPSGKYIVKIMVAPDSFFGNSGSLKRLETVSKAINKLNSLGLPVENIQQSNFGTFVLQDGKSLLRVYDYIQGEKYSSDKLDLCCRSLSKLHSQDPEAIGKELLDELSVYQVALPLTETFPNIEYIKEELLKRRDEHPAFGEVLKHFDMIKASAENSLSYKDTSSYGKILIHSDFHPRNVIINDNLATLIDLDYLIYDKPFKCIGFSVLRFASFGEKLNTENLKNSLNKFLSFYDDRDNLRNDVINAMNYMETEKIFRIIYRYFKTGTYAHFLNNIIPVHLNNLITLQNYEK